MAWVSRGPGPGEDWVSGDMGDSAMLRDGGDPGPGGDSQAGRWAGASEDWESGVGWARF